MIKNYLQKKYWKNTLDGREITFFDENLKPANLVLHEFDCKTFSEYHDFFLHTKCLTLASVFEEFRKVLWDIYCLDCVDLSTAWNLSGETILRVCNAETELSIQRNFWELPKTWFTDEFFQCLQKVNLKQIFFPYQPMIPQWSKKLVLLFLRKSYQAESWKKFIDLCLFSKQTSKLTCTNF